jgi:hypothetical protein
MRRSGGTTGTDRRVAGPFVPELFFPPDTEAQANYQILVSKDSQFKNYMPAASL